MDTAWLNRFSYAMKIVLVGDAGVGKSWLVTRSRELYYQFLVEPDEYLRYDRKSFAPSQQYSPTNFHSYIMNVESSNLGNYQTNIWDTGGRRIFDSLRPLAYSGAEVFVVCFDITDRESFHSVSKRWITEVRKYRPRSPVLIVGTKSDLRSGNAGAVPVSEAQTVARRFDALYCETSAVTGEHVDKAFEAAVELGHTARRRAGTYLPVDKMASSVMSLFIPRAAAPPLVEVSHSTYGKDFKKILQDPTHADVVFSFVDDKADITAHGIVLSLCPSVFKDVFQDRNSWSRFSELFVISESSNGSKESLHCENTTNKDRTHILMKSWISQQTFSKVLRYIYTGKASISKDSDESELKDLLNAAQQLEIKSLVQNCEYFLQVKTGTNKNLEKPAAGKRQLPVSDYGQSPFLSQSASVSSDVTFHVGGTLVYAHKAIIAGRSPVFAALLSGVFSDGKARQIPLHDIDCAAFLAVLEYLYTDHCSSLFKVPVEDVLVLADRLCLSRLLQMCEVYIWENALLSMMQTENHHELIHNILEIYKFSEIFNAHQLKQWCLHFMATNFTAFEVSAKKEEFLPVQSQNHSFFEENRWPPQTCMFTLKECQCRVMACGLLRMNIYHKKKLCLPYKCSIM